MRAVAPRTGAPEIDIARDQLEYSPLVAAMYKHGGQVENLILVTRWRLDDEERAKIAAGEDVYLGLLTFGEPMQPIMLDVGPEAWACAPEEPGGD